MSGVDVASEPAVAERKSVRRPLAPRSVLGSWLDHHAFSLVASVGRMLRKPWATALTVGVMAVAMALPLGLWASLANVQRFAGEVQQARQISVFLKNDIAPERASALAGELRARSDIGTVELRTPEQGLAELRSSGLGEAIGNIEANPLPSLLVVTPTGDETLLAQSLQTLPEADLVQHDAGWRERLDNWLRFGTRVVLVLAALLGFGALLVVGNTVRLDIQSRREEIAVLQLLGATDGFIRRPFLYLGAAYGVVAGILALAALSVASAALRAPLLDLAGSYGSTFALRGFTPVEAGGFLLAATVIGWIGALFVTGHYLRQTRATET